jgi:hypothetical protein
METVIRAGINGSARGYLYSSDPTPWDGLALGASGCASPSPDVS